jgi:hypothetical protein
VISAEASFPEWIKRHDEESLRSCDRPSHPLFCGTFLGPGKDRSSYHLRFVAVGLPGLQFIQDDLEFFTTTFHMNMDVYDCLVPEDLMPAAVILSGFAYDAAVRDEMIPRTPDQRIAALRLVVTASSYRPERSMLARRKSGS